MTDTKDRDRTGRSPAAQFAGRPVSVQPTASTGTALAKGHAEPGGVSVISAHLHR